MSFAPKAKAIWWSLSQQLPATEAGAFDACCRFPRRLNSNAGLLVALQLEGMWAAEATHGASMLQVYRDFSVRFPGWIRGWRRRQSSLCTL
ncbi:hypothetical protein [Streptomyces luteolus]|uniref:Uncharacterized protein n=1 Tax=Streptomyces luteolus TaxID=3043615 RepID=A0ABT6SR47_9ACTN|nr:hypothetical protein [Streptomyces sp. B-S-A12]MDI3417593.1 hypothetical protein [Streptomyces sp. B-S-A12]